MLLVLLVLLVRSKNHPKHTTVFRMSAVESTPGLTSEEYGRRKVFLESLSSLTKSEYIEIVRILKKHEVHYNENQNGIFFNVANLAQAVFNDLDKFIHFSHKNRLNLSDRDTIISTLKQEIENS